MTSLPEKVAQIWFHCLRGGNLSATPGARDLLASQRPDCTRMIVMIEKMMKHLVIWISNIHIWMMRRVIIILVALRSVCDCEYAANVRYVDKQGQVGCMCLAETAATVSRRSHL